MPVNIRKDGIAKKISLSILGPPSGGLVDSFGNKKRYVKKKKKGSTQEDLLGLTLNRFEDVGYR